MHLVQKVVMPLQSPTSLRRRVFIWIVNASSLVFLSHAFQQPRLHHFHSLSPTYGTSLNKHYKKLNNVKIILNHSDNRRGDGHSNTSTDARSKRRTIRRIRDCRLRKNANQNKTTLALISVAGIVSILSTGAVQRIAVSVISYTTAKYTYDLFEKIFVTPGDGRERKRVRARNRLKDKFQKRHYSREKEKGSIGGDSIKMGITTKRISNGAARSGGVVEQSSLNSNPNGKAWLKQSMDNLEETDRMISDLKRQEAEARAAEQKAKAREWVNETLRATTNLKARADTMRKQEEEARHKAQKWAESVARQSGVDLN